MLDIFKLYIMYIQTEIHKIFRPNNNLVEKIPSEKYMMRMYLVKTVFKPKNISLLQYFIRNVFISKIKSRKIF